jgi:DNA-binding NarL/FixJ family response regulator
MLHRGHGRRVGEIADEPGVSFKTVSTHRARGLEKLGLARNVDVALSAREHDLLSL